MGGNYEKGMYRQLMDVMARLDVLKNEHKKDRKEISSLTSEAESFYWLQQERKILKEEDAARYVIYKEVSELLRMRITISV